MFLSFSDEVKLSCVLHTCCMYGTVISLDANERFSQKEQLNVDVVHFLYYVVLQDSGSHMTW